ncbi:hypothetical protein BO86DRAFT_174750 [Aspergillus japonicus CBS 114.51]|uniref:Uncharacterized protein n=1 Tax=Aspergillus japonicus CBS 114.51 TaxID=1448312 RepID=A0A8T8WT39_ASPJA|nr:hypothetical protein BO86DRAFT_174750 [Aspergillus japonicus CBS 114.51]RAH78824.1 hypothetical protein BO86DRAFT_174750 [Aspergillus japonicus CBS 114.51]
MFLSRRRRPMCSTDSWELALNLRTHSQQQSKSSSTLPREATPIVEKMIENSMPIPRQLCTATKPRGGETASPRQRHSAYDYKRSRQRLSATTTSLSIICSGHWPDKNRSYCGVYASNDFQLQKSTHSDFHAYECEALGGGSRWTKLSSSRPGLMPSWARGQRVLQGFGIGKVNGSRAQGKR